jgi:hypothetical protein
MRSISVKVGAVLMAVVIGALLSPVHIDVYRSVTNGSTISIESRFLYWFPSSDEYKIYANDLYLRVRRVDAWSWGMAVLNKQEDLWDNERIRSFVRNHPELEEWWPAPEEDCMGVAWIGLSSS